MTKRIKLATLALVFLTFQLKADEGMWLPLLLEKYNIDIMKSKGFKLSAEDIYSINQACMKDAIISFNHGSCTGEIISGNGLIITNHHCGLSRIQSHSSVEHDYLTNGFWAMSKEEELPDTGLSVSILVRMEDVTEKVLSVVEKNMQESARQAAVDSIISKIKKDAVKDTRFVAELQPFFYGNQYYLFVMEEFYDVRLVGAPPSAIGNFGGDTDNWMWPRHTGDFSLFRIYAGKNNQSAEYSADNVPYTPKKYFPISLKGVKEGDFTMVFGYPGSTYEYLPSYALEMLTNVRYPHQIRIRDKKLDIINMAMQSSPKVRIQYTAKAKRISNSWKRWIGEINGLKKLDAIEKKKEQEKEFTLWLQTDKSLEDQYGKLLPEFERLYKEMEIYGLADDYLYEIMNRGGMEIIQFASLLDKLVELADKDSIDEEKLQEEIAALTKQASSFFKDYDPCTGEKLFAAMLSVYIKNMGEQFMPEAFKRIRDKYKDNITGYVDKVCSASFLTRQQKVEAWLKNFTPASIKQLFKDPCFALYKSIDTLQKEKVTPRFKELTAEINRLMRSYISALMQMEKDSMFYPDANSTLRISYGQVKGYVPADGVYYKHYTTLNGIMEKDNPEIYDYDVPARLKELYKKKDFGRYGENGQQPVCFIATNHTTGGNSGSPVINANGELIGINFDRAWEGVMSDLMYNPEQCRNISVDMRYVLFIIDKYAGADYLIDEMTVVE